MAGDEWREMNGGRWMAGTKRLFLTHDIHTQYIISSHTFHCSFSHKVTFYTLRNNFRSSSCAKNTSMWQRLCAPACHLADELLQDFVLCTKSKHFSLKNEHTLLHRLESTPREIQGWAISMRSTWREAITQPVTAGCAPCLRDDLRRAGGFRKTCQFTMSYGDRSCRQCEVL